MLSEIKDAHVKHKKLCSTPSIYTRLVNVDRVNTKMIDFTKAFDSDDPFTDKW